MSSIQSLINYNFGGIRRKNSQFSENHITCSDCQNVELFFTELNSGVGIRTAYGNKSVSKYTDAYDVVQEVIPSGESVIGMFETNQDGNTYFLVYTESATKGYIYNFDKEAKTITTIVSNLTKSDNGCACGVDFQQGTLDMFVFSNGNEIKYIYSDTETHTALQVETADHIHLEDVEGNDVMGLSLAVYDSRLWISKGRELWYSKQLDCRIFDYVDPSAVTSSGVIHFVKPITAIHPYLGSLAIFHKDSSALVTKDSATVFKVGDESPGGCAGYDSLVFHGTDLYFYDDTKKGVFSFQQVVNGDKTLGENIAYDIQNELLQIDKDKLDNIRATSVVTADRNEVWFLTPIEAKYKKGDVEKDASIILIFDYIRGEWVKRKCPKVNCVEVIDSTLYSANTSIYQEYVGSDFDGDFIDSYYTCTILNLGSDNTLKITKFPPRATLDNERKCHFWVQYTKNYNRTKSVKNKELKGKTQSNIAYYDSGFTYDSGYIYSASTNVILKFPSATFKALEIKMYTKDEGDSFALKALEFSKIKVKQI